MFRSARYVVAGLWVFASAMALLGGLPMQAGAAPASRGYELVSPSFKNGGDVMSDASRTRTSLSSDAVSFSSLTTFGDALGSGIATDYISQRTGQPGTSGWKTHAIMPKLEPLSVLGASIDKMAGYQGDLSDDLSKGIFHTYTSLSGNPNVSNVSNLYLRQDALASGPGSYDLLTPCPACSSPLSDPYGFYRPALADATPDLGDIIFEATRNLTADAPPQSFICSPAFQFLGCTPRLYESDHGTLRLVGRIPVAPAIECDDNGPSPCVATTGSVAGALGALQKVYTPSTISDDGSRIFFAAPETDGNLYMREAHTRTVLLNASERTDCADNDPCSGTPEPDPSGPLPATFQTASADGSKVFFTSNEQLTDASGSNLYVYDTTRPANDPHNLAHVFLDKQPADGATPITGVVGASADGSYLYFFDQSQLLAGGPDLPGEAVVGLYMWHNGTVRLVGSTNSTGPQFDILSIQWFLTRLAARVSPDGGSLLFVANNGAGLTGYDHGGGCGGPSGACTEIYLYTAASDTLVCVSCNPSGARATADATFTVRVGSSAADPTQHLNHPLSDDGQKVFFETAERLVPEDINGRKSDVYEYDVPTKTLHLISTGQSESDSHFLEASPSGRDVFFTTNQRLNGWDQDNSYDLYDARIEGGVAEPTAATPECTGEICQGIIPTPPSSDAPGSSTFFHGTDNKAKPRKRALRACAKGKTRKLVHGKVRCIRVHKKHKPKAQQ